MQWCSLIHLYEKHQNRTQGHLVVLFFSVTFRKFVQQQHCLQVFSAAYLLTSNSKAPILVSFAVHGWSFTVLRTAC